MVPEKKVEGEYQSLPDFCPHLETLAAYIGRSPQMTAPKRRLDQVSADDRRSRAFRHNHSAGDYRSAISVLTLLETFSPSDNLASLECASLGQLPSKYSWLEHVLCLRRLQNDVQPGVTPFRGLSFLLITFRT